jgi:hypothetical protein
MKKAIIAQGKTLQIPRVKAYSNPSFRRYSCFFIIRILDISALQRMTVIHFIARSVRLKGFDHGY